jgi:hypothetical protein
MRGMILPVAGIILAGIVVGFGLGGYIGFVVSPVTYTNVEVKDLRPAQKDDWVYMVGGAFALDANLTDAKQRLSRLDSDPPAAVRYVADLAQRAIDRNDTRNARNVSALAIALGAGTPAMRGYLQSVPPPAPASK